MLEKRPEGYRGVLRVGRGLVVWCQLQAVGPHTFFFILCLGYEFKMHIPVGKCPSLTLCSRVELPNISPAILWPRVDRPAFEGGTQEGWSMAS